MVNLLVISLRILGDTPSAPGGLLSSNLSWSMTSSSDIIKSGGISYELENILGGPGLCFGNSGSEHNDDISEEYLLSLLALSKGGRW